MAQRDNMPEGTDSIIEGASGASSTSPSNADVVGGSFGSGGAAGLGGASGAGLSSGATGAIGGANTSGSLGGDFGSSSGATGLGGASGGGSTGGSGTGGGLSGGVQNLKSQATDKARAAAMQGKDRATDALGNVSTLVRDAGQMIDERLGGGYGDYARKAADAVDSFTEGLRGKEVDELFDDAQNLIRKSPGVAIGIAATVGFVLVRALKAGTQAGTDGVGTSSGGDTMGSNALAADTMGSPANDGATPPFVSDRGGIA